VGRILRARLALLAGAAFVIGVTTFRTSIPQSPQLDAEVYAALIQEMEMRPVPDTLLVADSTPHYQLPGIGGVVTRWRQSFDSIPAGLPARLAELSARRMPSDSLHWPRPIRVLTHNDFREIFANGPKGWEELYRRFPRQRAYMSLSRVAYSEDFQDALVYREYHCGGRCGRGELIWLSRRGDSPGDWRVRQRLVHWIS
jgi:hypothetical protein